MNAYFRNAILVLISSSLVMGCDFENKIRRILSDPSGRTRDSLKPNEVSSQLKESEPNDRATQASTFKLTNELRPIRGSLSDRDLVDWVKIEVPTKGDYKVVVRPDAGLDISLYTSEDSQGFNQGTAGREESLSFVQKGTLFFGVKSEGSSGIYNVEVTKLLREQDRESEPNDEVQSASLLKLSHAMVGKINQVGDRDIYRLQGDDFSGSFEFIGAAKDSLNLRFCEDEKLESCSRTYSISGETLRIPAFAKKEDKTLFLVVGSEKKTQDYRILTSPDSGKFNESEPNDSFPTEVNVSEETSLEGYLRTKNDVDRFTLKGWGRYFYRITVYDPDLQLSASIGRPKLSKYHQIDVYNVGNSTPLTACSIVNDAGTILSLKMQSRKEKEVFKGVDYLIEFFPADNSTFEREPNDNQDDSQRIGNYLSGELKGKDLDLYRIDKIEGSKLVYRIENRGTSPLWVQINDDEGAALSAPLEILAGRQDKLDVDFPPGTYFLKLKSGENSQCLPYHILDVSKS